MRFIPKERRKLAECYFCGTRQSVKYIVTLKPNVNAKFMEVFCCNKCALLKRELFE